MILTHPDVVFYDFYEAWDEPIEADKEAYLNDRTGILAQAAPNIGPLVCLWIAFVSVGHWLIVADVG